MRITSKTPVWSSIALTAAALMVSGCTASSTDCRQARAACADGFTCFESVGRWSCQPKGETGAGATKVSSARPAAAAPATGGGPSEARRKQLTREATTNLRTLFDASVTYYTSEFAARDGRIMPRQFPDSVGLTPTGGPACADGRPVPYSPDGGRWHAPTWQHLNFWLRGEHYFRYEYVSSGRGAASRFTARAIGDLDCDGVFSTFERVGVVDAENNINGGAGLFVKDGTE